MPITQPHGQRPGRAGVLRADGHARALALSRSAGRGQCLAPQMSRKAVILKGPTSGGDLLEEPDQKSFRFVICSREQVTASG